jgi:hypothetical protein
MPWPAKPTARLLDSTKRHEPTIDGDHAAVHKRRTWRNEPYRRSDQIIGLAKASLRGVVEDCLPAFGQRR